MDWLIWVIVIVLVVAIVWWLMSRNKTQNSPTTQAPAAMEPADRGSMPDTAAAAAGVAGLAGVTNPGTSAAEGSGPTREEPVADEPIVDKTPVDEPAVDETPAADSPAVDETPAADSPAAGSSDVPQSTTPGLTVEEPAVATPVVDVPVVDEPVVDTDAKLHAADAGDVDDWGAGEPESTGLAPADNAAHAEGAARADEAADKAEWESSWTDESGTPVHHHEYTDAHSPTLPGAERAAAEDSGPAGHLAAEHPYGHGSSSTPGDEYPVKASAATMTYHDEAAMGYEDVSADVWFESAAHAEAAGFRPPRRSRH